MESETTNLPLGGSDSARPSDALDNPENLNFWEPGDEDDDQVNSETQTDGIEPDSETDDTADDGEEADDTQSDDGAGEDDGQGSDQPDVPDDALISIGGQQLTMGEVKAGYMRDADYRRKTQLVGNKSRDLEALSGRVNGAVHKIADFLAKQIPDPPHPSLAISDPGRFVREKAMHEAAMQQLGEIFSSAEEVQTVKQTLTAEQHQELVTSESEKLAQALPHLRKPGESKKFFDAAFETGRELGYTDDEMNEATDSRLFLLAHYARIGMAAEKAKQVAKRKVQDVPPYSPQKRPQGPNASRTRANQEAVKRLEKTGSIHDAVKIDFV
jgi:hypothetical protein